jgi:hypothetical protein
VQRLSQKQKDDMMQNEDLQCEARQRSFNECKTDHDVRKYRKRNNFISKAIGVILRNDRHSGIVQIFANV